MSVSKDKPNYKHDCKECKFLGSSEEDDIPVDLYVCTKSRAFTSIISRFGDGGGEYASVPHVVFAEKRTVAALKKTNSSLVTAYGRAIEAGFLKGT